MLMQTEPRTVEPGSSVIESPFQHIVVEGPIGVGKTTLARRLAECFGGQLILEAPADNPFLERFYRKPATWALATQLSFLLQRVRQADDLARPDLFAGVRVADYLIEKDRLFAELTLAPDEFEVYEQLYAQMTPPVSVPDLVIYLQAPARVLRERISARGINFEQRMGADYLQRLTDAYTRFFYNYNATTLLIVNAAEIDLAHGAEGFELLVERLGQLRSGRYFFNPSFF